MLEAGGQESSDAGRVLVTVVPGSGLKLGSYDLMVRLAESNKRYLVACRLNKFLPEREAPFDLYLVAIKSPIVILK